MKVLTSMKNGINVHTVPIHSKTLKSYKTVICFAAFYLTNTLYVCCRVFEKLRCEKRLLEDKYRSLKDKYIRLKTDIKISMERRKRRDAGGTTTASDTEHSSSRKAGTATDKPADTR
jgi:hypothetical protein